MLARSSRFVPVVLWMIGALMTHDAAVLKAREIASRVLAPNAGQNDKAGRFSTEAVASLGESGLLGLMLPADAGGLGSAAMRICGGAAFSKHLNIERLFRDAHAGAVMAPTGDVLREFIGKSLLGIPLF